MNDRMKAFKKSAVRSFRPRWITNDYERKRKDGTIVNIGRLQGTDDGGGPTVWHHRQNHATGRGRVLKKKLKGMRNVGWLLKQELAMSVMKKIYDNVLKTISNQYFSPEVLVAWKVDKNEIKRIFWQFSPHQIERVYLPIIPNVLADCYPAFPAINDELSWIFLEKMYIVKNVQVIDNTFVCNVVVIVYHCKIF